MFKRVVCMVLLMTILTSFTNASAATKKDPDASLQSTKKPSSEWNWSNGEYPFSGAADYQPLYTNYLFTDASIIDYE